MALLEDIPFAPLSELGPLRRRDYEALPDEPRCELIYGRLYICAAPLVLHQRVLFELAKILDRMAQGTGGEVVLSPVDVVLADHSVVQPDLVYLTAARRGLADAMIEGAPDLVVEVLSPGSARRDRVQKLNLYAGSGVTEYWLVDPVERQFDFLVNQGGHFVVGAQQDDGYISSLFPESRLDLRAFWASVDRRVGGGR